MVIEIFLQISFLGKTVDKITWLSVFSYTWRLSLVDPNCRLVRRESAGGRFLGFRVRIPPRVWMSVVCCEVEVSASGWSLAQRSPTECGFFWSSVIVKPWQLGRRGTWLSCHEQEIEGYCFLWLSCHEQEIDGYCFALTVVPWTRNRWLLFCFDCRAMNKK